MIKKSLLWHSLILMVCILCVPAIGFSKTGYVSDSLILTLREGPGREFPVIQSLKSDTPLEILEEKERYYKVKLESGMTGWVNNQYVVFSPTKNMIIDQLKKEKKEVEENLLAMKSDFEAKLAFFDSWDEKKKNLIDELTRTKQENKNLMDQLASEKKAYAEFKLQNKDGAKVLEQNQTLAKANEQLLKKIKNLKAREKGIAAFLKEPALIKWFLAGVGVLLLGWLLGHSVSLKKDQRRSLID